MPRPFDCSKMIAVGRYDSTDRILLFSFLFGSGFVNWKA